jgi:chromosomal replication initiation ATPase DnaA
MALIINITTIIMVEERLRKIGKRIILKDHSTILKELS